MIKNCLRPIVFVICIVSGIAFHACQDILLESYDLNTPVYMSYDELRTTIRDSTPIDFEHPGKIYIKGDYLFVNEVFKGIHVIDNSDPASPEVLTYIPIPGNVDMAIKGDVLYADSYIDLVAIDIADLNDIKEISRQEDVFEYSLPPYEVNQRLGEVDQSKGVVVGWKTEKVTEEVTNPTSYGFPIRGGGFFELETAVDFAAQSSNGGKGTTGTGGSMARFIIYKDILYAIDISTLHLFDVEEASEPWGIGSKSIGWNIETVFISRDHLFIGAMSGMYIYNLENPMNPEYVSTYWHVTSCDPVVVEGNYAYITLRTGNTCETDVNQLDVVDIENLNYPEKIKSYTMVNPHGLGIDDDVLFICDGEAGLKIYDASDPYNIKSNKLASFPDINAYDVIPLDDHLIMIGEEGLFQYDYSDVTEITLLSILPIFGD